MVAIVSGNSLGLNLSSLATLGRHGVAGTASEGRNGPSAFVNVANGNLVLQNQDDLLVARGIDAATVRTYNSQGLMDDDNGDNWGMGAWLQPLLVAGTLGAAGSSIQRKDRDGSVASYAYDASRTLYVSTEGDGAHDTLRLVTADNLLEWRDGSTGRIERYEASGARRLLSTSDTSGNSLSFTYGASGHLASVTSASGEATFYDYSGNNLSQVRTVTAGGSTSTRVRYAYDTSHRLTRVTVDLSPGDNSVVDGKVYETTYTYDGASKRIASVVQADGKALYFTYVDAGGGKFKVSAITDALQNTTAFTYGVGFSTVTDPQGNVTRYDTDAAGRLTRITPPTVAGGTTGTRHFTYSASGDVLSSTDGEGRTVSYGYDSSGNQVLQRDHAGNTITRTYDQANRVTSESLYAIADPDAAGVGQPGTPLTTRYVYDAAGRGLLRFVVSAAGRVTEHRYTAYGEETTRLTYQAGLYPVAGLAASTLAEADLLSWVAAQDAALASRVDMSYDARGQVQTRTSYARLDAAGVGISDGTQSVERYVYDQGGLLLQQVSGSGASTSRTYDGLGRALTTTDALGTVTLYQYDDVGRTSSVTLASGLATTSTYDAAGRLVAVLQSSPSAALGQTRYFYDASHRLCMVEDPTGVRQWILYDPAGRKAAEIDGNGTMTEYTYGRQDLVTRVDVWGTAVSTAGLVDANGAPVPVSALALRPPASAADSTTWRAYDAANRLVREARSVGTGATAAVTETRYDGASRIVETVRYANVIAADGSAGAVSAGAVPLPPVSAQDRLTRHFYDADGRLAGTLDGEGYLTTFQYDGDGLVTETLSYATATDPALRAIGTLAQLLPPASAADLRATNVYDGKGQMVGQVDAEGYLTENVYDAAGNLSQSVRYANRVAANPVARGSVASIRPASSAADRATLRTYDALNRMVQETSPEGVVSQFSYDSAGNLVSRVAAKGTNEVRTLLARYDLQGRLTGELSAVGAALLTGGQTQAQVDAIWLQHGTRHAYDAAGRRISSVNPAGARTFYFYNADGALTHTVNALGEVKETRYDTSGRVAEEYAYTRRMPVGSLVGGLVTEGFTAAVAAIASGADLRVRYTYTRDGGVSAVFDGQGNVTYRSYNAFGEEIETQEGLGGGQALSRAYTLDRRGLRTGTVVDPANAFGLQSASTVDFDAFGRAVRTVDGMGNVREQSFDRLGRVVTTRDALNALTSTSYDAFGRVLTRTDALGNATTYTYNATARSISVRTPEGVVSTTTYSRHGQVQVFADGKGQTTSYSYDPAGRLLRTTTPLTIVSDAYDASGRLIESTDANGKKVAYTYDAANRVLTRRVDPAGLNLVTTYAYDARGQQVSVTDPNGVVTTTDYDNKGQTVRQTVDPAGLKLQTTYVHDARGNVLRVTSPAGTITEYTYDALGRRKREIVDPAGLNLQRTWTYDKNGNTTSSTDGLGNLTRFVHDAENRLVCTINPVGSVRHVSYDAQGRVVRTALHANTINTVGLALAPTLAEILSLLVPQPAQDVVEHRVYDKDGRMVATVDGTGAVVRLTYDANGNVIKRVAHASRINVATWAPGTVPAPAADVLHDASESTVYDALNRAIYTVNGVGAVVSQSYDGNGNVLQRTGYAAPIPTSTASTQAAIQAALAAAPKAGPDATVRNTYDAAGRLTWSVDGMGAVTQRVYDKNGNVVRQVAYANLVAAGAAPTSATVSAQDRATSMAYDSANRLVLTVDALRGVTEQAYDAAGNIVRQVQYGKPISSLPALGTTGTAEAIRLLLRPDSAVDRVTWHGYDAAGRQVLTIDAMGAVIAREFDPTGKVVAETAYAKPVSTAGLAGVPALETLRALVGTKTEADRTTLSAYDPAGQRWYAVDPTGAVVGTWYDGVGRVVRATRYAARIPLSTVNSAVAIATAVAATNTANQTEHFGYNAAGHLIAKTNALGGVETSTYDALGNRLTLKNEKGFIWTYGYDAAGRLLTETTPTTALTAVTGEGAATMAVGTTANTPIVTRMSYDALGNLTQRTEASGRLEERTTRYEYDALGRQVRVIHPSVGVYAASSDAVTTNGATGIASRVENMRALETQTFYDALGNAVASRDVGGALSQKAYDTLGRVAYEVDALGYVTGFVRNAYGEVTLLTRYGSATTLGEAVVNRATEAVSKTQVEALLASASFNHASDRTLVTQYDRAGRVVEVREPIAYVYDAGLAAGGNAAKTTRNTYDAFGQLVQVQVLRNAADAWATTTHYYDAAGRQQATIDALGYLTWRQYDAVGNLTEQREYATARAPGSWSLAGYGSVALPAGADRSTGYTYDRLNRLLQETRFRVEFSTTPTGVSTTGNTATTYAYDAVGNRTRVTDAEGKSTYTQYDALGRVSAVAAPARVGADGVATVTPLAVFRRDAHGNVVARTDYANGTVSVSTFAPATASADDRTTLTAYDSFGRAKQTTDAAGASEFFSYDAHGHVAKSWRGVTGNDGITRTLFQVNVHDRLGQLVETRTPASTTVFRGGMGASYTTRTTDADGAVLSPNRMVLAWSSLVDPTGGTVRVQVDYLASSTQVIDEYGRVWSGQAAHLESATRELAATSAAAGTELTWTAATDSVAYIRVMQLTGSQWVTKWEGSPAQANGSGIADLTQAQAGLVYSTMEYNGFGEMTRKGTQGGRQEFFDYDTAGRLWRTNSGDGVDRIHLYDALGQVTAEIRSSGSGRDNADIKGFISAQAADANPYTRRVDLVLDALGRVTARKEAPRLELQGGVSIQRQYTTAAITQSATATAREWGYGWEAATTARNAVSLGWNSLSSLGSGDVKVYLQYRTPVISTSWGSNDFGIPMPVTYTGGTVREQWSGMFTSEEAASGVSLAWTETGPDNDIGIGQVTRIVVYKKDAVGNWVAVVDQQPGYGGNMIDVAAPPNSDSVLSLQLRVAGSSGDTGWFPTELKRFGDVYRFDARGLALGNYEYRVTVRPPDPDPLVAQPGEEPARITATGALTITQPPLNTINAAISYGQSGAGVLSWIAPAMTTSQVLRYRPSGSSAAWTSLAISPRNNGARDGVDTSALAAGTYQFELLWSESGQGVPTSHATGTFTVVAAIPPKWVPPVNLPNIGGVSITTTVVGGVRIGWGDDNGPIYSGGTTVPALRWNASNATVARYRVAGGTWSALAINNDAQRSDESVYTGYQVAALNGIAPGTYEVEILASSPQQAQATGRLVVYAQSAGYYQTVYVQVPTYEPVIAYHQPVYETRYATRTVSYVVWVDDPRVFLGYDEYGRAMYSYPGHYETRYREETYSYQVQVGTTPVYARDEYGNLVYQTIWVTQAQQQWVPGTTPAPTITVTTPPYTPGYTVPGVPAQYSASVTTGASTSAISTSDGAVLGQAAGLNGDARWLRPTVLQKTDRWGNVIEVTDPRAAYWKTTYRYNANNQLVQQTQPDAKGTSVGGPVTSIFYDRVGRQVAVKDANGNLRGQVFDAGGNLVEERNPYGTVTHRYDAFGQKVRTIDAEGRAVSFTYDKLGHILRLTKGAAAVYRVNADDRAELVETRNIVESWTYDQIGRKLTQTNGNNETLAYTYDLRGNVVETRQPMGQAMRAAFDAGGRKVAEVDGNGFAATWSYDYFGLLIGHQDLGGARYTYGYDNARQLVAQTNTRGQSISYGYDAAGQVTSIQDWANGKTTSYVYDISGRRVRERVTQGGVVYQDSHLAYDTLGRLRDVADARVHLSMEYDKVGNRTRVATYVNYQGVSGEASSSSDRYFKYDAMNRQVVVDAVDAAGNIGMQQGHEITYDRSGNRVSDRYWGTRVATTDSHTVIVGYGGEGEAIYTTLPTTYTASAGYTKEVYAYDALNRLHSVERDGLQIDLRHYDGADRVIQSGPGGALPVAYADIINQGVAPGETNGKETRINRYDANGRLLHQKILKSNNDAKVDISWDPGKAYSGLAADGYDDAGNVRGYVVVNREAGMTNEYTTTFARYDGYKSSVTTGASTQLRPGTTTQHYDANGFLVGVTDATQSNNNRTLVNDASGVALYVKQAGHVQRQLVVNGEVLGIYGAGVDPNKPTSGGTNPNFANLVDFDFGYSRISASYPNASPGAYQVRAGDTLRSIAQSAYGDSSLWYRIAEANGLGGDQDMRVDQTLNIPSRVSTISNNDTTFKPYDPSRIEGDMTPSMAMPDKGCGGVGQLVMVIVAIVVTVYTGGQVLAMLGQKSVEAAIASGAFGELAVAGAAGAAAGSVASQVVGVGTGTIQKFDWKGVALSAIAGGLTAGLPSDIFGGLKGIANTVVKAAVANALTQGIGVVTGLQKRFDWRGVAASALGAGIGDALGAELGLGAGGQRPADMTAGQFIARAAIKSVVAGIAAAAARGGKVVVQQVAADAFGNALGSSLAGTASSVGSSADYRGEGTQARPYVDVNGDHIVFGPAGQQADVAPFLDAFGQDYDSQWGPGVQMADASGRIRLPAGWSMKNGRMVAPDGTDMGHTSGGGMVNINIRDGQAPAAAAGISIRRQLANMEAMADAYRASRMTGATGDPLDLMTPDPISSSGGAPAAGNGDRWYPHDGGGTLVGRRMTPEEVAAFDAEQDSFDRQMRDGMNERLGKLVDDAQEHYVQNGVQSSGWRYGSNAAGYIASEFFPRSVGQAVFEAVGGPLIGRAVGAGIAQLNRLPVVGNTLPQLGRSASSWLGGGAVPHSRITPSGWAKLRATDTSSMTRAEKGVLGEARASLAYQRAGYEQLPSRLASNNGFDGVFVKKAPDGTVVDIIINESKFASAGRASLRNTNMGKQMSPSWINENIQKMMNRFDDPAVMEAGFFLDANRSLIRTKANVLEPLGSNRWNVLQLPK